jgi:branched-chain amino acid transport system ATP-binding protein
MPRCDAPISATECTSVLAIDDLRASYGNITALGGVSISIASGETVAVIGPNGAGKSTLLLSITGVVKPTGGAIRFAGREIAGAEPEVLVAGGISLVPEGRRIFGSLTVAENLRIGATVREDAMQVAKDMDRVLELFPILRERGEQKAGKLSGGEQQMLAIARALLSRPRLLLLDEPSLGLAPLVVARVYETIARLKGEGLTVLLVEQSMHRALAASDRAYVLNSGRVALSGRSSELAAAEEFEAAYFGLKRSRGGA